MPLSLRASSAHQPPSLASTCAVCLEDIELCAPCGGAAPWPWPRCGHTLHLGCAATLRQRVYRPACPTCRAPWDADAEAAITNSCAQLGVRPAPPPEAFAEVDACPLDEPPAPPPEVVPLCCDRVYLAVPERVVNGELVPAVFRPLGDRRMDWAPDRRLVENSDGSRRTVGWSACWTCPACSRHLALDDPLLASPGPAPRCPVDGPQRLVVDCRSSVRAWACVPHCAAGLPPTPLAPQPAQPGTSLPGHAATALRPPAPPGLCPPGANKFLYDNI